MVSMTESIAYIDKTNKICCEKNITQQVVEISLRNNPEGQSSHLRQGKSLKSRNICCGWRHYVSILIWYSQLPRRLSQ